MHVNKIHKAYMSRIHNLKKFKIILGSWKCISLEKVSVNMFFWKILEVSILGGSCALIVC